MHLKRQALSWAIRNVVEYGDTDIFPYPFELKFIQQEQEIVLDALTSIDISKYTPMSLIESLVPKTKFGFRVGHQQYPIDTIIFTALVGSIFDPIEEMRDSSAFSYRKSPGFDGDFFRSDRRFKNWISELHRASLSSGFSHAIRTDISDFYARIYRHRLENIISSLSKDTSSARIIERIISDWRGRQSFGLPVGGDAARLLAEAALHDTDLALVSEGYSHTRYVDDIVIFVRNDQDPYAALAFLARHLSANEGLSLNNQKTTVMEWSEFIGSIYRQNPDDEDSMAEWATEKLFWSAYGQNELGPEALEVLMLKDLVGELEAELAEPYWDMGAIRIILHAMRLVENQDVAGYVRKNLHNLVPFSKDVCLLIERFQRKGVGGFDGISGEIVDLVLSSRMSPLDCSRSWFLELGVRGVVHFTAPEIRKLDSLSSTLDTRQLHLIRWRSGDINFFRSRKVRVSEIQSWAQPSFIFGARCLPKDEYEHWVRSIRSRLQFPLGREFADWCLTTYGSDPLAAV